MAVSVPVSQVLRALLHLSYLFLCVLCAECVQVHVGTRGVQQVPSPHLIPPPLFLKVGSLIEPGATISFRPVAQQTPEILLPLPSQPWDYRCMLLHLAHLRQTLTV